MVGEMGLCFIRQHTFSQLKSTEKLLSCCSPDVCATEGQIWDQNKPWFKYKPVSLFAVPAKLKSKKLQIFLLQMIYLH